MSLIRRNIGMLDDWPLIVWEKKTYVFSFSKKDSGISLIPRMIGAADRFSWIFAPSSLKSSSAKIRIGEGWTINFKP
jgi:hypothetical protein